MSVTDNNKGEMARGEGDVRSRLRQAALALYLERGYERTTAAEIAAHAGVTERTFFRHFADKREVLFDGEAVLRHALTRSVADAPDDLGPLGMLFHAFRSVLRLLEDNLPFSKPRHEVISSTPALQERELAKMAALSDALAAALEARGVAATPAALAARAGMAAFVHATIGWIEDAETMGLGAHLDHVERELERLLRPASAEAGMRERNTACDL